MLARWSKICVIILLLEIKLSCCTSDPDGSSAPGYTCPPSETRYMRHYDSVCCGNITLRRPMKIGTSYLITPECSEKIKDEKNTDLIVGIWNGFICDLQTNSTFKSMDALTFDEFMTFTTQYYPKDITDKLKENTKKCSDLDSQKIESDNKIEKFMECLHKAEYKMCNKPNPEAPKPDKFEEFATKELTRLRCPKMPEFHPQEALDHCCKKRSIPYPVHDALSTLLHQETSSADHDAIHYCVDSFAAKERELVPEAFAETTSAPNDHGDHGSAFHWDYLCAYACYMERRNYTQDMLKLDMGAILDKELRYYGKSVAEELKSIVTKRQNEKIFLAMDADIKNSKPMDFKELDEKFQKSSEKDKIQYYCKFVDTMVFELERGLHVYCTDEKSGDAWAKHHHHSFASCHDEH